jgi:putative endonuclease
MWYVYILLCENGSLYTGIAVNVEERFHAHLQGRGARYTRMHKPIEVIYTEEFLDKSTALKREYQIKHWSRKQKIAFIYSVSGKALLCQL